MLQNLPDATHMITMVMGNQDGYRLQIVIADGFQHPVGLAGVHKGDPGLLLQHPDIVVGKRGNGGDV
jgi:hypothetical protein